MDRKHRLMSRRAILAERINETARSLEWTMSAIGVPTASKDAFLKWTINKMWSEFKDERMKERIVIENEIRKLEIRLPNGTVNKEYSFSFQLPLERISNVELCGAQELGLTFTCEADGKCTLSGHPLKAGDFALVLRYSTLDGEEQSELRVPVAFNPDPRSLWRNIPTDEKIPYFKHDFANDYIKVSADEDGRPRKDIVVASQRGRSHAQEGKARDDDYGFHYCDESGWYVIAVADGAGSAKYSRYGSELACKTAVKHCRELLADNPAFEQAIRNYQADRDDAAKRTELTRHVIDIVYNGAKKAHDAVKGASLANEESVLKDFSTTLMFAICKRYDFGWFIASFWVGDGAMCLYNENDKTAKLLGTPDEGEFSGQTRFLTMPEIFRDKDVVSKRMRMAVVPDFTALFLMTDGVSDPMFETDNNLNSYQKWEEFYNRLKTGFPEDGIAGVDLTDDNDAAKNQLLSWLDFWSPGNHDDRTIAILY